MAVQLLPYIRHLIVKLGSHGDPALFVFESITSLMHPEQASSWSMHLRLDGEQNEGTES